MHTKDAVRNRHSQSTKEEPQQLDVGGTAHRAQTLGVSRFAELDAMTPLVEMRFKDAFSAWLDAHAPFIQPRTIHVYRQYGEPLVEYLGTLVLGSIGAMTVRGYQLWRSKDQDTGQSPCSVCKVEHPAESFAHGAGSVRIVNEINGVLKPMLKQAGVWQLILDHGFRHLPVPRDGAGTFIPPDAQLELIGIALNMPRLALAGHVLRIMSKTGAGPGEILKLRRRDYDREGKRIHIVVGAKNAGARIRWLYLTPSAFESMEWVLARWTRLGGEDRNDFLFPHRSVVAKGGPFTIAMAGIEAAWSATKKEWIRRHPERADMAHVRLYDFRVSVAIVLLRNGKLSLPTIKKVLGWAPSSAMIDRYFKETQDALRAAMNTLEDIPPRKAPKSEGGEAVENAS